MIFVGLIFFNDSDEVQRLPPARNGGSFALVFLNVGKKPLTLTCDEASSKKTGGFRGFSRVRSIRSPIWPNVWDGL